MSGCPCVVCPGSGSGSTTSQLVNVLHLQTNDRIEHYSDHNIVSIPHSPLCHGPEHRVVPTDGGPVLVVLCFGVANLVELRLKLITILDPWSVLISSNCFLPWTPACSLRTRPRISASGAGSPEPLLVLAEREIARNHIYFFLTPHLLSSDLFRCIQSIIDELLHIPFQPSAEVLHENHVNYVFFFSVENVTLNIVEPPERTIFL